MEFNDFSEALLELKCGGKVQRMNWDDDEYLCAQFPDENSKMGRPYIYKHKSNGRMFPYLMSNSDLFAEDWYVYEDVKDISETADELLNKAGDLLNFVVSKIPNCQKSELICNLLKSKDSEGMKKLIDSKKDDIAVLFLEIYGKPYCDAFFKVFTVDDLTTALRYH